MRNNTFWESASRPLFVRSVWLETAQTSRAPQRHFILDYEAQKKLKQRRQFSTSCENAIWSRRKESLQYTFSYECSETEVLKYTNNLSIASRKLQLQPPLVPAQTPKTKPKKWGPRRLTKLNLEKLEPNSSQKKCARFSATSINNCLDTPVISKRLAERVLNWLDLAVKGMPTETANFELDLETNNSPSAQRCSTAKVTTYKPCSYTRWKKQEKLRQQNKNSINIVPEMTTTNPADVKCVSIVFDHARLVKTASCQTSQGTLKRLPLLENNMHKSADFRRLMRPLGLPLQLLETLPRPNNKTETIIPVEKTNKQLNNSANKKCLVPVDYLHDTRKQLHIFMPSLPDKPHTVEVGAPSMIVDFTSTVDSASALSFNESEI